jgi:hypothetical protein
MASLCPIFAVDDKLCDARFLSEPSEDSTTSLSDHGDLVVASLLILQAKSDMSITVAVGESDVDAEAGGDETSTQIDFSISPIIGSTSLLLGKNLRSAARHSSALLAANSIVGLVSRFLPGRERKRMSRMA